MIVISTKKRKLCEIDFHCSFFYVYERFASMSVFAPHECLVLVEVRRGVRFLGIIKMEVTDSKGFIKYNYIFQRTKYSIYL